MKNLLRTLVVASGLLLSFAMPSEAVIHCPGGLRTNCPSPDLKAPTTQDLTVIGNLVPGSWTTSTRPASPVAGQIGFNNTTGLIEFWSGTAWLNSNTSLPNWTTSTRPVSPATGTIGFNSTTLAFEFWNGSAWSGFGGVTGPSATTSGFVPAWDGTSGTSLGVGLPVGRSGNSTIVQTSPSGTVAPAVLPSATTSTLGAVKPDGSTITILGGVLSSSGSLPVVSAASFGVLCDGSHDDTSGIQNAINSATGHATSVILPAGTCLVTGPIYMAIDGVRLIGQGGDETIIQTNQASGNVITVGSNGLPSGAPAARNASNTVIQGMKIQASVPRTGGAAIYRYSGGWNVIRDVKILNMWQGIVVDGSTEPTSLLPTVPNSDYNNFIMDSWINSNSHGGVIIGTPSNTNSQNFPQNEWVSNSDISVNGVAGILIRDCGGCNFPGAVQGILNSTGILIAPSSGQEVVIFANNIGMDSSSESALDFEATGTGSITGQFTDIWMSSSGNANDNGGIHRNPLATGIRFNSPQSAYRQITFLGGKIYNNASAGIYEAQATQNLSFTGVDNVSNSSFSGGGPLCPTSAPNCNNQGLYANYMAWPGSRNISIVGGNWGIGNGLLDWPSYGISTAGTLDKLIISGVNLGGTLSSGTCEIDGAIYTGGISCGGTTNSKAAALGGTTGGGGGGSGNVTSTGGSPGNILSCSSITGCTTISGSSYTFNGATSMNPPPGATLGSPSFPWGGLYLSSPLPVSMGGTGSTTGGSGGVSSFGGSPSNLVTCGNAGCTSMGGSAGNISGSSMNLPGGYTYNAGGRAAAWSGANSDITSLSSLGSIPSGTTKGGLAIPTMSYGGAPGNLVAMSGSGAPDQTATGITAAPNALNPPNATLDLGDGAHFWKTLFAQTGTINTSDERLKDNITDETLGLDFILSQRPVEFDWKPGQGDGGHHSGLIAQEVEKTNATFGGLHKPQTADEYYGLNYGEFTGPIIKSIQQLDAKVQHDERQITLLWIALGGMFVLLLVTWRKK